MRVRRTAVLTAAALALLPMAPAHATGAVGPVQRVTGNNCYHSVTVTPPDGITRGFANCSSGVRYVQGSGTTWSTAASPYGPNEVIAAVAVDGSTTWMITSNANGTFLRSRTGTTYNAGKRLTATRSLRDSAALLAVGGRYLAVWSDNGPNNSGAHLWEAHTLGGNAAPKKLYGDDNDPNYYETNPQLAYQPSTHRAVLVWQHQKTTSITSVLMTNGGGGPWATVRTVAPNSYRPSLALSGSTVAVGYGRLGGSTCGCAGAVSTGTTSGMTATHALSGELTWGPLVAVSNGVLGAVWVMRTNTSPQPVRITTRSGGVWSERILGTPYPQGNAIEGVGSAGGRLRFFATYDPNFVGVRSQ